jgi:hypothetical protein
MFRLLEGSEVIGSIPVKVIYCPLFISLLQQREPETTMGKRADKILGINP